MNLCLYEYVSVSCNCCCCCCVCVIMFVRLCVNVALCCSASRIHVILISYVMCQLYCQTKHRILDSLCTSSTVFTLHLKQRLANRKLCHRFVLFIVLHFHPIYIKENISYFQRQLLSSSYLNNFPSRI